MFVAHIPHVLAAPVRFIQRDLQIKGRHQRPPHAARSPRCDVARRKAGDGLCPAEAVDVTLNGKNANYVPIYMYICIHTYYIYIYIYV